MVVNLGNLSSSVTRTGRRVELARSTVTVVCVRGSKKTRMEGDAGGVVGSQPVCAVGMGSGG